MDWEETGLRMPVSAHNFIIVGIVEKSNHTAEATARP
jgi:hypothetical protein